MSLVIDPGFAFQGVERGNDHRGGASGVAGKGQPLVTGIETVCVAGDKRSLLAQRDQGIRGC